MTSEEPDRPGKRASEDEVPAFTPLESLTAVVVIGALALALALVAFLMPAHTTKTKSVSYTQSGTFGYSASAPPSSIYGSAGLTSGQPIQLDVVGPVTVRFGYTLDAPSATGLKGTTSMVAKVKLAEGLTRQFTVAAERAFEGATTTVAGQLPATAIRRLITQAAGSLGVGSSATATITLQPRIKMTGSLAGHALDTTYKPELPLALNGTTLSVSQGTDVAAVPDQAATDPLKPSDTAKLSYQASEANTLSLLIVHPSVVLARVLGLVVALACLLLALWLARPLLRSGGPGGETARVNTLYGSRILEVRALSAPKGGPVADVVSIGALADLAKRYESMIMHVRREGADEYLVWDNGMIYRYSAPSAAASSASSEPVREQSATDKGESVAPPKATAKASKPAAKAPKPDPNRTPR